MSIVNYEGPIGEPYSFASPLSSAPNASHLFREETAHSKFDSINDEPRYTILIVNDEAEQLDLLHTLLEHSNYQVLTASDGAEAFETACAQRPDLIISDVCMPGGDGITLCRQIRQQPVLCFTPVLLISALPQDDDSIQQGLQAGADAYMQAPYDSLHLIAKVAQLLERQRGDRRLRESEEQYRVVTELIPQQVWIARPDGALHYVNRRALEYFGCDPVAMLGWGWQQFVHPDDLPACNQQWRHSIQTGQPYEIEFRLRHQDGSDRWHLGRAVPIRDQKGEISRWFGTNTDIEEQKETARVLLEKEEMLRQAQKMEAIGQLAGGVAHDFNNLLTAIIGYSELMQVNLNQVDPLHQYVEEIKKAGERAAALTRQLLAFSRRQILQPQALNLNEVISDMARMLPRLIGENIDLRTVLNEGLGSVKADPGQIEQVILNLAVNARDAMPQGGQLIVETHNVFLDEAYVDNHIAISPGAYVMLAVSDTGCGMDEETRKHIFEPFFTTKEPGKGTGLGLATVYGIVKQSRGNIWVYSEVEKGTAFKIYLPRADEEARQYQRRVEMDESPGGTETILLVEDEESLRNLSRDVLLKKGYVVLEAANGDAALQLCRQYEGPIHLLLTDLVMPKMSGPLLAEQLLPLRPEIRVVCMSGYTPDTILEQGELSPSTQFISKPFTLDALAHKVRAVLDEARK